METPLEIQLQSHYAGRFRRIWVARTRYNSVCITVFPTWQDHQFSYRIVTREKVSRTIDFDYCRKIIDQDLSNWNPLNTARMALERNSCTEHFLPSLNRYIDLLAEQYSRQLDEKYGLTNGIQN